MTDIAGIVIPSTSPVFLGTVAIHVLVALAAVVSGPIAMLSHKGPGRHPTSGKVYYWSLAATVLLAMVLAAIRPAADYALAIVGSLSFATATFGRWARRRLPPSWARMHIAGMGSSYVLLLTAFYVDNGKNLPLWRELPTIAYWLIPAAVGAPLIVWAMIRHPLARAG